MREYGLGSSALRHRVRLCNEHGTTRAARARTPEENRLLELERENKRMRSTLGCMNPVRFRNLGMSL